MLDALFEKEMHALQENDQDFELSFFAVDGYSRQQNS